LEAWRLKIKKDLGFLIVRLQPDLADWTNTLRGLFSSDLPGIPPSFTPFPGIPPQVPTKPTTASKWGAG